jgi:phasin family protein
VGILKALAAGSQAGGWQPIRLETLIMVKFEDFQVYGKEHFDAAVASAGTLTKGLQAIATAVSDYSKKSFEDGSAFVEKLASVKSLDKAIEVQTDYAKAAYETLVAESTKIGGIYADLAKEAYKPVETFMSKLPKVA